MKTLSTALVLLAFLPHLLSCQEAELTEKQNILFIESPFLYKGTSAVFYDTLKGARGSRYNFDVLFPASQITGQPGLSFDGSGYGSEMKSINRGFTQELYYEPATEGSHPIILFWHTPSCGYFPKEKIIIHLFVQFEKEGVY